jgi:hypothetical protein
MSKDKKHADSVEKTKAPVAMCDLARKRRGRALDEMQARLHSVQTAGNSIPTEWREKTRLLAETDDANEVDEITRWMEINLPPQEYNTADISWPVFHQFARELINKLTLYVTSDELLTGKRDEIAVSFMKEIASLKDATPSAVIAMAELARLRARVIAACPNFSGE